MNYVTIHRIKLSKMQKLINVLALASFAVSGAIVGTGAYVYINKDAIIESVIDKALGSFGELGGGLGEGALPIGTPDLEPPIDSAGGFGLPVPSSPL